MGGMFGGRIIHWKLKKFFPMVTGKKKTKNVAK